MAESLVCRLAAAEDTAQVRALWEYCFDDMPAFVQWFYDHYYRPENTMVIGAAGQLAASAQFVPYTLAIRGAAVPAAYLIGVSTTPEARGRGQAQALLQAIFAEMRRRGQTIGILVPFAAGFYQRGGWQFCYSHYRYRLPLAELGPLGCDYGVIKRVDGLAQWQLLDGIYRQFTADMHGYVLRGAAQWQAVLTDLQLSAGYCAVLYGDSGPEGYVLYRLAADKLLVSELAYSRWAARGGLLAYLWQHRSQVSGLDWPAPIGDPAALAFPQEKAGTTVYPYMMARIVDAAGLLAQTEYDCPHPVRLRLHDALLPWNDGVFEITAHEGRGSMRALEDQADWVLEMGIASLTALVMGSADLKTLLAQEAAVCRDDEVLRRWQAQWPLRQNYIVETF